MATQPSGHTGHFLTDNNMSDTQNFIKDTNCCFFFELKLKETFKLFEMFNPTSPTLVNTVLTLWPWAKGIGLGKAGLLCPLGSQRRLVHNLLL